MVLSRKQILYVAAAGFFLFLFYYQSGTGPSTRDEAVITRQREPSIKNKVAENVIKQPDASDATFTPPAQAKQVPEHTVIDSTNGHFKEKHKPERVESQSSTSAHAPQATPSPSAPTEYVPNHDATDVSKFSFDAKFIITEAMQLRYSSVLFATHPTHGVCLLSASCGTPITCSSDEAAHHESLVHAALLLHPHPRRVLIVGGVVEATVREALKHHSVTNVTWVAEDGILTNQTSHLLPEQYHYNDTLQRVRVENMLQTGYMKIAKMSDRHFDVIIIADDPGSLSGTSWLGTISNETRALIVESAQAALLPGGILALNSGSEQEQLWADRKLTTQFFTRHFYASRYVASFGSSVSYMFATRSEAPPDPTTLSPTYVDERLRQTTVGELQAYDGASHVHMFAIPKDVKKQMQEADLRARKGMKGLIVVGPTPAEYLHAPYSATTFPNVPMLGQTIIREYYGCNASSLTLDLVKKVVKSAVQNANDQLLAFGACSSPNATNATVGTQVTSISVVGITESGSIGLHAWPEYQYVAATITNYNNGTALNELMAHFSTEFGAIKSIGSTLHRGDSSRIAFGPVIDHVKYAESLTAGRGFPKPKIVLPGPFGGYLRRKDQLENNDL
ncbi:hypothetical protein PhCBS80983_g04933 [Powellomyces hirtus]|uniref:PABS domain-containing protein n=1 Tax=Powellomyces hirtus TaxID=109895 RepID=A0A507DVW9_9FUNG|nr:hypothetical protein PhCBS80983_g04933 [Powellomyces hirtus]